MISITVPSEHRRVFVQSFWFTVCALCGVSGLVLAWALGSPTLLAVAVIGMLSMCTLLFAAEALVWRIYNAWNGRLVRPLASIAAHLVMRWCFFIIFIAGVGSGLEARFRTKGPAAGWTPRSSLSRDAYRPLFAAASSRPNGDGWIPAYLDWATRTENVWAVSLLPFLAALKLLTREEPKALQANIYTLF